MRITRSARAIVTLVATSTAAAACSWTRPAQADASETFIGLGIAMLAAGDITFSVRDIVAVANDEHPGMSWSVAESIFATPQAVGFGVFTAVLAAGDEDEATLGTLLIAPVESWTATLAAHGIWAAAKSDADPGGLFGVSPVIGGNFALTLVAVGSAAAGRWTPTAPAVIETLGSVPGVVLGAYHGARDENDRGLWIGLTAWSGTLLLHGLVSAIVSGTKDDDNGGGEPPPPPPPPPEPEKPTMVRAAHWIVTPTTLFDVSGRAAPAVSVSGQLW